MWLSVWSEVQGADYLHLVHLMPLHPQNPIISCLISIQTGFVFLVPTSHAAPALQDSFHDFQRCINLFMWWGAGVVVCLEQGASLHMAQLMPLPLTASCFSKIQIGFTFLVPAHLGSPGNEPLNGCVCV